MEHYNAYVDRRRQAAGHLVARFALVLHLQADDWHVPAMPIVDYLHGARSAVQHNLTSLPQDAQVTQFRMLAIDTADGRQVGADYPRLSAVRMNGTPFSAGMAWWSADSKSAYFVDLERGEKVAHVVAFDVATGETRVVFNEASNRALELGVNVYAPALIFPLPHSEELVWYSERSGRGHLYLVDLRLGLVKRPLTSGQWQVREVLGVDQQRREVFFLSGGIDPDDDPYLRRPCIASLDREGVRLLSNAPGDHIVWRPGEFALMTLGLFGADPSQVSGLSPDGAYFVETVGAVDRLPQTVLRRRDGELVRVLEAAEDVGLPADWRWPQAVRTIAADGVTD